MTGTDLFRGTGVAMITPFNKDGDIDFDRLMIHANSLIEQGINYLVILGTTAETPTLSSAEKKDVQRCVIEACAGRVPLMLGIGGNDTKQVIDSLKKTEINDIHGILSVSPYYNKPSQEGIYQHFSAMASVSDLPIMLYNVPGRTASNMSAETMLRLASDFRNAVADVCIADVHGGDRREHLVSPVARPLHDWAGSDGPGLASSHGHDAVACLYVVAEQRITLG